MSENNLRQTTLCFLFKEEVGAITDLLLAMKKRGFGQGRWNGTGGKFSPIDGDKNIVDTARRETEEEIGVKANDLIKVAVINFYFPETFKDKNWDQQVHIFFCKNWQGEPRESEEMKPAWFKSERLPYDQMWPDDTYWLPLVMQGKKLLADFFFADDGKVIKDKIIKEVEAID